MNAPESIPKAAALAPRRPRGFGYVPAIGPRLRIVLAFIFAAVALLGASGIYLLAIRLLEWYKDRPYQTQFSLWMFLVHVLLGVVFIAPFLFFGITHLVSARNRPNRLAVKLGICLFISGIIVIGSGLALIQLEGLPQLPTASIGRWVAWGLHVVAPVIAVALYVLHRRAGPEIRWRWGLAWGIAVVGFVAVMIQMHSHDPRLWYAKGSREGERYFEPASSRTVGGKFIPASVLLMDEYCLKCHADIYKSHLHSAHRFSSFSNPAYLFSVQETRERVGVRASRWCAGCHDPGPFFSGSFEDPRGDPAFDPARDKERLDLFLEVDDVLNKRKPALDSPVSRAGITCTVCHAMTHVNSRSGNGDYTIEEPVHYPFAYSDNPVLQWLNNQLVKAKPDFHKKTFLKPFHRSSDFCSTCHKVGVPMEVNHYKEFLRGQNHPDAHLLSGQASGARSFYYPARGNRCADCHMPLMESNDFGRQDFDGSGVRKVHNHIFLGANTGVPALVKYKDWEEVVTAHQKFLQGGPDGKTPSLRLDLFGLKHLTGEQAGVEAPLIGDAPLRPQLPRLEPGGDYLVEVVVRTLGMGHIFTQGTADSNEVWVDFTAKSGDRVIGRSGAMEKDGEGRVDPWAHFINILMLDRNGNRIDRRNPQDIFTPLYDHQIPPGAASVVHYRLHVPGDVKAPVELSARVRFRKFDYTYMEKVHGKGPVPKLPIVDLCSDRVVLPVARVAEKVAAQTSPIKPAWQRWNDYGIACFLEGGPEGKKGGELGQAEQAFARLVGPEFKDVKEAHSHGWLNLARVHLAYGGQERLDKAREALTLARQADPPAPWWTVSWFNGLLNMQNVHFEEAITDFETILKPANQPTQRRLDFTKDFLVINELGKALFWRAKQEEGNDLAARDEYLRRAIATFEKTLALDAENVDAHEFINKCFATLAGEAKAASAQPGRFGGKEAGLWQLAKDVGELGRPLSSRMDKARELLTTLSAMEAPPRLELLAALRQQCLSAAALADSSWLQLALQPVVNQVDRQILAALPLSCRVLADPEQSREQRLEAARRLNDALAQLGSKRVEPDVEPVFVGLGTFPAPRPVSLALACLAERDFLGGPMRQPRLLALHALRQQVRPVFSLEDAGLREEAAQVLARLHLILHGIYKPDENAAGRAVYLHRSRFPAADHASHSIVIYALK
jgi:hypothetical protein